MNDLIKINDTSLEVKEYNGQRVVTFKDIDTVHSRPNGTARKRFNDNKTRFIEGEDFWVINQPSEIRTLGITRPQGGVPESVTLIAESGYLMLVKSFTDELAWSVQRQLVKSYFKVQHIQKAVDSYMIDDPVKRAERWIEEQKEKQQLLTTVAVQEQQIQEFKPKASYYDLVLNCPDLLSTSVIAKDYGKSAKWLNAYLREHGIQFKQGGIWLLYQKYAERGYTSTKTHNVNGTDGQQHPKVHTYWTQKGRLFIYDLLKSDGIYPIVEQNAA